jgi:hypothetical protein
VGVSVKECSSVGVIVGVSIGRPVLSRGCRAQTENRRSGLRAAGFRYIADPD